jgi:hypothetical protein
MKFRASTIALCVGALGLAAFASPALAQVNSYSEDAYAKPNYEGYVPPKNGFGQPDIAGVWSNATTTPVERPREFTSLNLTEEQAASVQGRAETYRRAGDAPTDPTVGAPTDRNTNLGYNRFWTDPGTQVMRVNGQPRSSILTTPDGRVPARKPGAPPPPKRRVAVTSEFSAEAGANDGPESRGLPERCIFMPTTAGAVMRPVLYNNNYQVAQGSDSVAIWVEMIHDLRVIRIGGKHNEGSAEIRPWMGDGIGWYEGNSLVVETINYHPFQELYGASDNVKVTERFTRVADNRLLYQFSIDDPVTWDAPWGGEYEFWSSEGIYEYACHEGNHGMIGILEGARELERQGRAGASE